MITLKNKNGDVILEAGEFSDALAQTLIEENATEATPLKLGNVHFFRADGRNCYFEPTSSWNSKMIVDDLINLICRRNFV